MADAAQHSAPDSLICPITKQIFSIPVIADDGYTYEESAILRWLEQNPTSPMTKQPLSISSLRLNRAMKILVEEFENSLEITNYRFVLDVDVKKCGKPIFHIPTKSIYNANWMKRKSAPPIILMKMSGVLGKREASYCVQLSRHPHIVRTYGIVEPAPQGTTILVQELAPESSLDILLENQRQVPDEMILIEMFAQLADAMAYLAYNRVTHGDLACRNVLVFRFDKYHPENNLVKLTDFGLTRHSSIYICMPADNTAVVNNVIPIRYAAPEFINDQICSEKTDMYSMGVTMWEGFSKCLIPWFEIVNDNELCERIKSGEKLKKPIRCSNATWNLMLTTMNLNPQERPTFSQLRRSLTKLQYQLENTARTHTELMQQFKDVLEVDMNEVYMGIAVEQTLVKLSGLNIDQTGATFRRKHNTDITVFRLKLPSEDNLNTFIRHHNSNFRTLIVGHEREMTSEWVKLEFDTKILNNHMVSIVCN